MNSSQKIVVTFNKNSRPIGEEGNELTQFMGTLVRVAENVGIDFREWRMVPDHKKEDLYLLVKVCIYLILCITAQGQKCNLLNFYALFCRPSLFLILLKLMQSKVGLLVTWARSGGLGKVY